ncbi:hypothetical protein BLOT_012064, partial [Blomia tropicalis]
MQVATGRLYTLYSICSVGHPKIGITKIESSFVTSPATTSQTLTLNTTDRSPICELVSAYLFDER